MTQAFGVVGAIGAARFRDLPQQSQQTRPRVAAPDLRNTDSILRFVSAWVQAGCMKCGTTQLSIHCRP